VVAAVECAIAIQKLMVERNAETPEARRTVYRIGVNLGDVLISGAAYEHTRGRIDAEFIDLGEKDLKNIARPVRAYALASGAPGASSSTLAASPPGARRFSIVVLPCANLSSDPEQQYFADGVTENLTTDLSRLRGAFVISRNTAFTFKGKAVDVQQIGKELGVRYVLEGSVQRDQDRVRVNAQLIDGETGAHLWADRFQEDVADLFKLQDDVVARLANALSHELLRAEAEAATRSNNPNLIDLVMRGRGQ
jgi:TolB-like protein